MFGNVGIAGEDGGEIAGRHGGEIGKIKGQRVLDDLGEFDEQRVLDGVEREFADRKSLIGRAVDTIFRNQKSTIEFIHIH